MTGARHRTATPAGDGSRWMAALFLLAVGSVALRSPGAFLTPVLSTDDGLLLARMQAAHDLSVLTSKFAGYISLQTNILTFLTVKLTPLEAVPYVFSGLSVALFALTVTVFCHDRFAGILGNPQWRALCCFALLMLPTHTYNIAASISFGIWNSGLLLILLTATGFPKTRTGWAMDLGVRVLLAWSNPLALILLPVHALGLARLRQRPAREGIGHAVMAAAILLYLAVGLSSADRTLMPVADTVRTAVLLLDKGMLELFAAKEGLIWLYGSGWIWYARIAIIVPLAAICAVAVARQPPRLSQPAVRAFLYFAYVAVGMTAIYVVGRRDWAFSEKIMVSARFFYPVKAVLLIMLALAIDRLVGSTAHRTAQLAAVAVVLALAVAQAPLIRTDMAGPFQGVYYRAYLAGLPDGPGSDYPAMVTWEWNRQKRVLAEAAAGGTVRWDRGDASITLTP